MFKCIFHLSSSRCGQDQVIQEDVAVSVLLNIGRNTRVSELECFCARRRKDCRGCDGSFPVIWPRVIRAGQSLGVDDSATQGDSQSATLSLNDGVQVVEECERVGLVRVEASDGLGHNRCWIICITSVMQDAASSISSSSLCLG